MAREKPEYRAILESLLEFAEKNGKGHLIGIKDVAKFLGINERTAKKRFCIGGEGITIEALAMRLAAL